ncbi:hypothetical protein [Paraburkholderia saeva]|uniref:Uncharacterized protein n=1 Tax=Paraburkholderia saeva TaxID=2777537 RepID=A0A9N8X2N1_9BURK|nr:hypothetical protein [Paraburkholderia saeva]CAG4906248.1 hypothetical protein LMG31841_03539 [Paraburkholderia saeva]
MDNQKDQKLQLAELEILVTALVRTCVNTDQLKSAFKGHVDKMLDSLESSPPGKHSEYSNEERLEISANTSEFIQLQLRPQ